MVSDISVIICAYTPKRWNELMAAVTSAQRQTLPAREIIVVIDHNPALFQQAQDAFSSVNVIENHEAKGLSGARNSGWSIAEGGIVAFLDDDAVAQSDWLEKLGAAYTDPQIMGVGGKIVPFWESRHPRWFPDEFNWVIGCTYRGFPNHNMPIRNMIGANMSIRRTILIAENGFRESFGCDKGSAPSRGIKKWFNHYAGDEETEFCIRTSQHRPDGIWLYAASATIQHRVSADRARWSYFLWRCYDEGLGKASLVRLHNSSKALSTERDYTLRVLPKGAWYGLADTVLGRDFAGISRSIAIVTGLITTTVGYIVGSISTRFPSLGNTNLASAAAAPPVELQRYRNTNLASAEVAPPVEIQQ